jgi:suppressor for copper-sensitivity B
MRADWTRPDPAIAMYLHHFGRFGIPLDVVYGPQQPQGEPLPELLTPGILLRALDHVAASTSAEAHLH